MKHKRCAVWTIELLLMSIPGHALEIKVPIREFSPACEKEHFCQGAVLSLWQKMLVLRAYRLLLLNYSAVPEPYVLAPANASCDGVGSRLCRASVGEENEEPSVTASPLSSR